MSIEEFIIDQNECVYRLEKYLKELNFNRSADFEKEFKSLKENIKNNYIFDDTVTEDNCDAISKKVVRHDGTLTFITQNEIDVLLTAYTLNNIQNDNKKVKIHVGKMIHIEEFGDFGSKEKPWIKSRTTHKIPIKFEYLD